MIKAQKRGHRFKEYDTCPIYDIRFLPFTLPCVPRVFFWFVFVYGKLREGVGKGNGNRSLTIGREGKKVFKRVPLFTYANVHFN